MNPTTPFDLSLLSFFEPAQFELVRPATSVTAASGVQRHFHSAHIVTREAVPGTAPVASVATSSPLTIETAYNDLVTATDERMRLHRGVARVVPEPFARRLSTGDKFLLHAFAWDLGPASRPTAQLRLVKIGGARSQIVNAWIFPATPWETPVFAAELIGVGDATRVAFIDIQTPAATESLKQAVAKVTKPLSHQFKSLPCDEAAPDWATCESTGHYTYARNARIEWTPLVCQCYLSYLDEYLVNFGLSGYVESKNDAQAIGQLAAYQRHHCEHSPGKKFLSNLFGAEWTESFMSHFLFANPQD